MAMVDVDIIADYLGGPVAQADGLVQMSAAAWCFSAFTK